MSSRKVGNLVNKPITLAIHMKKILKNKEAEHDVFVNLPLFLLLTVFNTFKTS
jgi:hypothetical protein